MTHTKDLLAAALREVGLDKMAEKAETGWYHDFLSPLDMPEITLVNDLAVAAKDSGSTAKAGLILQLRKRVINGDFDASHKESEEWARSPEGQFAMQQLIRKPK